MISNICTHMTWGMERKYKNVRSLLASSNLFWLGFLINFHIFGTLVMAFIARWDYFMPVYMLRSKVQIGQNWKLSYHFNDQSGKTRIRGLAKNRKNKSLLFSSYGRLLPYFSTDLKGHRLEPWLMQHLSHFDLLHFWCGDLDSDPPCYFTVETFNTVQLPFLAVTYLRYNLF